MQSIEELLFNFFIFTGENKEGINWQKKKNQKQ